MIFTKSFRTKQKNNKFLTKSVKQTQAKALFSLWIYNEIKWNNFQLWLTIQNDVNRMSVLSLLMKLKRYFDGFVWSLLFNVWILWTTNEWIRERISFLIFMSRKVHWTVTTYLVFHCSFYTVCRSDIGMCCILCTKYVYKLVGVNWTVMNPFGFMFLINKLIHW